MGERKGESLTNYMINPLWKLQKGPIVLSDAGHSVGRLALVSAGAAGLGVGGYASGYAIKQWPDAPLYKVVQLHAQAAPEPERAAQRLCIMGAHAVFYWGRDLRVPYADYVINTAKERRKPLYITADLLPGTSWQAPLEWLKEQKAPTVSGLPETIAILGALPDACSSAFSDVMCHFLLRWKQALGFAL